ncbi:protein jim lovell isoform X3 [Euwallacea fornicatus]|uniref:protein jim lovell isoform X3 n=1 Tax=Euwallacea fornicatus TaxID=995702 RepID=UPI00338E2D4D
MTQSHYSLRWNNHQSHILAAFEALLQAGRLVDVTLVCSETSIRAHKVVLSACSPLFQRIFSENPCKHPVIVLKDFSGWVVQAIIDFMYKGEISVIQEQLQCLMKAAESLQVRGLANQDPFGVDKESTSVVNQSPTPSTSSNDYDRQYYTNSNRYPMPGVTATTPVEGACALSPTQNADPPVKLPHMTRLSFPETLMPRSECQSPIARRKQSRPRRRSGELGGPQDAAENLCIKRRCERSLIKEEERNCTPDLSMPSPELDLSTASSGKEYLSSPVPAHQPPMSLKQEIDSQSPLPFGPMPGVPALNITPPHSKFFGLDSSLGLFPPTLDTAACRNTLFDMTDPRNVIDANMFVKKKIGRPKGQHSAPRGGPPRSWTNAELTEALQHVWNKKMTTSQASRIFGIPYNSLLMYVRGKYGKSLKLEQLRKDCIGGPNPPMELLGNMSSNNNNNNLSKTSDRDQESLSTTRPSSTDQDQIPQHPMYNLLFQLFGPFTHNFYPDFGTGFPIPVSMIHLLPQGGDKSRPEHNAYGQTAPHDEEMKPIPGKEVKEEPSVQDIYRPSNMEVDDRRELVQQNGQD